MQIYANRGMIGVCGRKGLTGFQIRARGGIITNSLFSEVFFDLKFCW